RRLSILAFFLALFFQLVTLRHQRFLFKVAIIPIIVAIVLLPFYIDILEDRIEYRSSKLPNFEDEGRVVETRLLIRDFENVAGPNKLIGIKFDAGAQNYFRYGAVERRYHTFYAILINNSGIIGLVLFIIIIMMIFFKIKRGLELKVHKTLALVGISILIAY